MSSGKTTSSGDAVSHYVIGEPLGRGGMGEVYAGFDETLKRNVALKAIRAERRLNAVAKARLLREAQLLSQLDHPNICRIYDYVEAEDRDFLVLELVQGRNLRDALRDGMDEGLKMQVAEQVAGVLVAAHAAGVVHRDLKPDNVMLSPDGDVKVLDFGLARSLDGDVRNVVPDSSFPTPYQDVDDESDTLDPDARRGQRGPSAAVAPSLETGLGRVVGTPFFMSPEQARGESATAASDMYSFGILLHELFSGEPAFDRSLDTPVVIQKTRKGETLPVQGVPSDLAGLIERLESLAPSKRPTAVETVRELQWIRDKPKRRLRRGLVAAIVGVLLAGGVKYTVDLQRERTLAVEAQQEADRRRDQAESLIGFMLGDLQDKLESVGRLDIMDDVGDRAVEYFASVPPEDLTEEELFRRAQAFDLIGRVRMNQGGLEAAAEAFESYRELSTSLAAKDPKNAEWALSVGIAEFWIGDVLRRQGDLDGAAEHYGRYLEVAEALHQQDPKNTTLRLERGYAHYNVGLIHEARGELEAALAEYAITLATEQELVREGSTVNLDVKLDLARSHDRVGVLNEKLGRLDRARRHYEQNLEILEELVGLEPDNATWLNFKGIAHNHLAQIFQSLGNLEMTLAQYGEDLELREQLSERDPMNKDWARELAVTRRHLGLAFLENGELEPAARLVRESVSGLDELVDTDPSNRGWEAQLVRSQIAMGNVLLASGQVGGAAERAARAISVMQPILKSDASSQIGTRLLADAYLLQGRAFFESGQREVAASSWKHGVEVIEPIAHATGDTTFIAILAHLLMYLDDPRAASEVQELIGRRYAKRDFVELCERKGFALIRNLPGAAAPR